MAQKMNLLAIDTSTSQASVALEFDGAMFIEEAFEIREHARVLLSMVERVLSSAGTELKDLDGIVFGEGPGSFTGLRIACSVAKGLAYAHDLPLYPVGSLRAIAAKADIKTQALPPNTRVLAMMDARMNQVYWMFDPESLEPSPEQMPCVSAAEEVCVPANTPIYLVGTGYEAYLDSLPSELHDAIVCTREIFPRADAMIQVVKTGRIPSVTADAAMPTYVRQQVTGG
ncbi:MAG: tRNA (adenosine(37)-N6)-threonylcarbamoyltransferase complex dimerization subunit type 1 TsaB [Legionellaceae bacterium]|nr:tRNA (adenosine(37)-N6)-threonylcarbamoyltransferase complex dimerization subunit type 1 TsaB [Legionellaceae bacterium]